MNKIVEILRNPHPLNLDKKKQIKQISVAGLIVFSFFLVFQPFGLKIEPFDVILKSAIYYGIATIAIGLLNNLLIPFLFRGYFNENNWTFGRNILFGIWYWFVVTITMIVVSKIIFPETLISFSSSLKMFLYAFLFGQFIIIIISYINQNMLNKKHESISNEIQDKLSKDFSDNEITKVTFSIPFDFDKNIVASSIYFIESIGNYLKVYWENEENKVKNIVVRKTLSDIENELSELNFIFKSHRSYIINIKKIERISGDSQGLKLKIKNIEQIIPVSRSKIKEFKRLFEDIQM